MSNVDLKLTQKTAWTYFVSGSHGLDRLETAIERLHLDLDMDGATVTTSGGTLSITLASGAILALHGVNAGSLQSAQGVITASGVLLTRPGTGSIDLPGQYRLAYTMSHGVPEIKSFSGHVDGFDAASLWPDGTGYASGSVGNVRVRATGDLQMDDGGWVAGALHNIAFSASTGYLQGTISGDFTLPAANVFYGASVPDISGVVNAADIAYADGSHLNVTGIAVAVNDLGRLQPLSLIGGAASNAGDDTFTLDVAPTSAIFSLGVATGTGNDQLTLTGGFRAAADLGEGNDRATVLMGQHNIDGGAGVDTVVVTGNRADYTLQMAITQRVVATAGGTGASLEHVERVQFADGIVALDIEGNAGQAYRLYNAALGRAPDQSGLGFWIGTLDHGGALLDVAAGFLRSDELKAKFGADASDATFITKLYENVLHRQPDAEGYQYWTDVMHAGGGRAQLLVDFSESAENKIQVVGAIQDGIAYTPFG